eukprot:7236715-Prymnesium_polylepis.1
MAWGQRSSQIVLPRHSFARILSNMHSCRTGAASAIPLTTQKQTFSLMMRPQAVGNWVLLILSTTTVCRAGSAPLARAALNGFMPSSPTLLKLRVELLEFRHRPADEGR